MKISLNIADDVLQEVDIFADKYGINRTSALIMLIKYALKNMRVM